MNSVSKVRPLVSLTVPVAITTQGLCRHNSAQPQTPADYCREQENVTKITEKNEKLLDKSTPLCPCLPDGHSAPLPVNSMQSVYLHCDVEFTQETDSESL